MKRVLCPKCENYLFFDETKYSEGQSLVFECEHCGKQFSIRLGKSKVKALRKEENLEEEAESHKEEFGYITVIENVFGYKQILPLQEGDNVIGRRCVGTSINTPIDTNFKSLLFLLRMSRYPYFFFLLQNGKFMHFEGVETV